MSTWKVLTWSVVLARVEPLATAPVERPPRPLLLCGLEDCIAASRKVAVEDLQRVRCQLLLQSLPSLRCLTASADPYLREGTANGGMHSTPGNGTAMKIFHWVSFQMLLSYHVPRRWRAWDCRSHSTRCVRELCGCFLPSQTATHVAKHWN